MLLYINYAEHVTQEKHVTLKHCCNSSLACPMFSELYKLGYLIETNKGTLEIISSIE